MIGGWCDDPQAHPKAHIAMAGGILDWRRMNARTRGFIAASETSPVVYASADECGVIYRLRNGKLFHLNAREARQAGVPRFAHLEDA